jgi:hypothetical protein
LVWRGQETCAGEISGGIVYVGGRAGSALASHSASLSGAVGRLQTYGKIGCGRRRIRGRLFHRRKEHPSHKALQRYGWAGKAACLGDMGVSDSETKSWGEFELWRALVRPRGQKFHQSARPQPLAVLLFQPQIAMEKHDLTKTKTNSSNARADVAGSISNVIVSFQYQTFTTCRGLPHPSVL